MDEELYGAFHYYSEQSSMAPPPPPPAPITHNVTSSIRTLVRYGPEQFIRSGSSSASDAVSSNYKAVLQQQEEEEEDSQSQVLRAKVASHPLFPHLLHAYIDCHKVGAPPEMAQVLEGIRSRGEGEQNSGACQLSSLFGADPELDDFMEMYCNLLVKYKSDISRPFDEAIAFINDMETQLNSICNGPAAVRSNAPQTDEITGSSEKDFMREEKECKRITEVQELKDNLQRRYSGYISNLKHEFSKNKKKEKLPKEAKQILLTWWNIHLKWPYPTDADKVALAEWTGLDQKQVNNWFINQRKRHWKPTNEMQAAVLDGLYGPLYE